MHDLVALLLVSVGARLAKDAMPAPRGNPPQRLHVDMEQFSGPLPDIADRHACGAIQVPQARQSALAEHFVDGRSGRSHQGSQGMRPNAELPDEGAGVEELWDRRGA